ncbi:MAG: hypothetical protein QOH88_560 [Verrucomicrobiota bacterium]
MKRLAHFAGLTALALALSSCNSVKEMVTSHLPQKHSGRPSFVVKLSEQQAYLYRGRSVVATSRISSGREGHRTPIGHFTVTRKDSIIAPVSTAIMWTTRAKSLGQTSMFEKTRSRRIRNFSAPRCRTSSSSRRGMGCTRDICRASPPRMAAFGCPIGKRGSSTTRRISAHQSL